MKNSTFDLEALFKNFDWGVMPVEMEGRKAENHGVPPPHAVGSPAFMAELQDTIILAQHAKQKYPYWHPEVHAILKRYFDDNFHDGSHNFFPNQKALESWMAEFGFNTWQEVCEFVDTDECVEMFVRIRHWLKEKGIQPKKDQGFIDGTGISVYRRWADRQKAKAEKAFDVKHFYKQPRPFMFLEAVLGIDCTCLGLGGRHPGHWSYLAQHANKFGEDYDQVKDNYDISDSDLFKLKVVLFVAAFGRSGCLYHYPQDNIVGFKFGLAK